MYPSSEKITVAISMRIENIEKIHELEMKYQVFLKINLKWYDSRLTFRNLKENKDDNQLNNEDIEKIWSPQLLFLHSNQKRVIAGQISYGQIRDFSTTGIIRVLRLGLPQRNSLDELEEDLIYPGNENPMVMTNYISVMLGCQFQLEMYPFDIQKCNVELIKTSRFDSSFVLKWEKPPEIWDFELMKYYVMKDLEYVNTANASLDKIKVGMKLRRRLSSHIFNTYIPTLCLITIAGLTLFIDKSHFEASIMVALTTMLVTYTLYQSISADLPHTSYMKMIDIWLFFGLIMPFVICCILIVLDFMIMREINQVIDIQKRKTKWNSKLFLRLMQILLPMITGILCLVYWLIGIRNYFQI